MTKFKRFCNGLFDLLDDVLAYILTIVGILCSNYLPLLKTNGHIDVQLDWWRVGLSAIVALLIIGKEEQLSPDESGSTDKSRVGRKKRFTMRMINALAQGVMWSQLISIAS